MAARKAAEPLRANKGAVDIDPGATIEYNGQTHRRTFHIFVNETAQPVDLFYFYDKSEEHRGTIEPGSNVYVGTYTFSPWKVKDKAGKMLAVHHGQSATVTVKPSGCLIEFNSATVDADDRDKLSMETAKGTYSVRAHAAGMPVWAFECVPEAAVERAVHLASRMLEGCPHSILQTMLSHRPALAIFGKDHLVTDVPSHSFMKYNVDRNLDVTSRGLGGTPTVPVTSCAEENLTMIDDKLYPCQSIFVHEFGHAVQNLGLDLDTKARVQAAYTAAVNEGLYPEGCYMISNDHEYWATGTEAWFESNIRVDVTGGVNTRDKVRNHDPRLAALLAEVYGDGQWRFHHDCPVPLSFYKNSSKKPTVADAQPTPTAAPTSTPATNTTTTAAAATTTVTASAGTPPDAANSRVIATTSTTTVTTQLKSISESEAVKVPTTPTITSTTTSTLPSVGPTRRLPGRSSAGTAAGPAAAAAATATASGAVGHDISSSRSWAVGDPPIPTSAGGHAPPNGTELDAPALMPGITHSPTSSCGGADAPTTVLPELAGLPGLWDRIGRCSNWASPLTTLCPGARMYPSVDDQGESDEEDGGLQGSGHMDGGGGRSHIATGAAPHSSEVIAILSGGTLTGGPEALAAVGQVSLDPPPLDVSGSCYGFPFSSCLQGREKKLKHSEKNV